jgi:hypothetical protein
MQRSIILCRAALKASGELWNLHQALQAEYSRHWDKAINLLSEAYFRPPDGNSEVKVFLASYAGFNCAIQFSNQLDILRK